MFGRFQLANLTFIFFALSPVPLNAEKFASIIIDDVGNNFDYGHDVITLPAALTIAILPNTTYAKKLARLATRNHKEVMLHLPMQSIEHHEHSPDSLDLHMTRSEFRKQLLDNINSVPYVRGVNNHMGSLLTRHPGHMSWLMDELSRRGSLYFIDSRTTSKSIADKIATEYNIPNLSRDFFLDPDENENTIDKQFARFVEEINRRGYALAIAHPYPKTIQFLQNHLQELKEQGINLVPVSHLIQTANQMNQQREKHYVKCTSPTCSGL